MESFIEVKEEVIAALGENNGNLSLQLEDWKCKYFRLEDENCELKKKVKKLENDKTFHINELQKNNNAIKEAEELQKKIEELEKELLKKVIIECGPECEPKPKGKPGRKPKEVK